MTTRQEVFIAMILSVFFVWCGYQFIGAQKAISRKLALDTIEEGAIYLTLDTEELHEKYTVLTHKTFDNLGVENEG